MAKLPKDKPEVCPALFLSITIGTKGGNIMSQDNGLKRLKIVLALFFVSYLFYGVSFLLVPSIVYGMSHAAEPLSLSWIRWSGGTLIALGVGAIQAFRNPARQSGFVTVATISALLVGLGLLYSRLFDNSTATFAFHMTPCFINLGLSVLLVWARQGAKETLN